MLIDRIKKNLPIFSFILFLIIGLAIYANSLGNQFFWDDEDMIVKNVYVQNFKVNKFFTENEIAGSYGQISNYWRPLLLLSFAVDYKIWGLEPFGFHLTNTLLHILAAWLVFLLLFKLMTLYRGDSNDDKAIRRVEKKRDSFALLTMTDANIFWLSFLPALFFLIHPLQTEAITYVSGRGDPLSAVFVFLSLLFYVSFRLDKKWLSYFWALLFFIAGLLVKEQAVLLPALVLLVEAIFFLKEYDKKNIFTALKFSAGFVAIAAVYLILRLTILNFNDLLGGSDYNLSSIYNQNAWSRLFTFFLVILSYFKLLFIPTGLHMEWEVAPVVSFFSWPAISFLLALSAIVVVCFKTWKENRLVTFGFLWFFIILLPRTNILEINRPMYEHWLYVPMIGFWLALFCLIFMLFSRIKNEQFKNWSKRIFYVMIIAYLVFLGGLTIARNRDWHDPITFYEKNLKYSPQSFIEHNNLGMAYSRAGRNEEAIAEYRRALAIKDVYPQIHYNLANSLVSMKQYDEAETEYKKAIAMDSGFIFPYQNLYNLYTYLGKSDEAGKTLELLKNIK